MSTVLEEELYSVRKLMDFSGESEACWRKRLAKGDIPYIKLGENVRVKRSDLERWLESRTVRGGNRNG